MIFIMITALALISCDLDPEGPPELSNEEHAVISTVLDSIIQQGPLGTIDVFDLTSTATNCPSLSILFERYSVDSETLLNHYFNANKISYSLNMDKVPSFVMLKDTEEAEPYSGYTSFTRPGISENGLLAVVEYSSVSAPLAGIDMAVYLEKEDGEWRVVWIEMIWMS